MKIIPKPLTIKPRPNTPAMVAVVSASTAPRSQQVGKAYQQLVTSQDVHPDRAKRLLGLP